MSIFIYVLVSTRESEGLVWYVGQSVDVQGRFDNHHARDTRTRKGRWLQREHADGYTVRPRIIQECPDKVTADEREAHWIEFFRKLNPELVNGTNGADNARRDYLDRVTREQRAKLEQHREWFSSLVERATCANTKE